MNFVLCGRQQAFRERVKKRKDANSKKRNYRLEKAKSFKKDNNESTAHFESSLEGTTVRTPEEFKKKIRQRVHSVHTGKAKLPRTPRYRCFVIRRLVKRTVNSPTTGCTMKPLLHNVYCSPHKHRNRYASILQGTLRNIIKHKIRGNLIQFKKQVDIFKSKVSVREGARILNMHYSTLQRLLTLRKKSSSRFISEDDKRRVLDFYSSNQISMQLPFKKYARYYYLRSPLAVAYHQYVLAQRQSGDRVLSKTAVYRCLRGKFRTRKKIPFKDCQCKECVNVSLKVDTLVVAGVKGINRSNTQNVVRSYCPIEGQSSGTSRKLDFDGDNTNSVLTDHNRDCIYRTCPHCGAVKLKESIIEANPQVDWEKIVTWHQWEKVEIDFDSEVGPANDNEGEKKKQKRKQLDRVLISGTLVELLNSFINSIHRLSVHIFDFRWQAFQYEECKKLLQEGDILMIMDFAQNYSHHRQDEIQSALWTRPQTTLHPIVTYYPCHQGSCEDLVKEELMMLSSDLKHDGFAVNKFIQKAIEHLESEHITVKRIIMFSDNCGAQYKSCKVFETLSRHKIPVIHHYFGASHGKGEADGAIGRLSMTIDAVVRSGQAKLDSCKKLVDYCQNHLTLGGHTQGMCCHYHRHYFEVSDIERVEDADIRGIRGTQKFHCVRNTGIPGVIEVRASSCFCEPCFLGHPGECRNSRLVKPFLWASLYKSASAKGDISKSITILDNTYWGGTSKKYIPPVNRRCPRKRRLKPSASCVDEGDEWSDSDYAEVDSSSSDSDYEDHIPLGLLNETPLNSPISSRTRLRLNEIEWVHCIDEAPKVDLDYYEDGDTDDEVQLSLCKPNSKLHKGKKKQKNSNKLMISGIQALTPGTSGIAAPEVISGISLSTPTIAGRKRKIKRKINNDYVDDDILGYPNFVLSGTPKMDNVIDLTHEYESVLNSTPNMGERLDLASVYPAVVSPVLPPSENEDSDRPTREITKFRWKSLYNLFQSCKTFAGLKRVVQKERNVPPLPDFFVGEIFVTDDEIDGVSVRLMPKDRKTPDKFKSGYVPLDIIGDGNCFPRSLSRLVYGVETHHIEMRCRIVIDCVRNMDNYTDHDYLMRQAGHLHGKNCSNICEYYSIYSGLPNVEGDPCSLPVIQSVFKRDILRIRKERENCDIWQIHSAANVLNSKIVFLFPTKNIRDDVRADHNRVFLPESLNFYREFGLMWTGLCDDPKLYNHIVPLVKRYKFTYKQNIIKLCKMCLVYIITYQFSEDTVSLFIKKILEFISNDSSYK